MYIMTIKKIGHEFESSTERYMKEFGGMKGEGEMI